jgi:hypothetical protein
MLPVNDDKDDDALFWGSMQYQYNALAKDGPIETAWNDILISSRDYDTPFQSVLKILGSCAIVILTVNETISVSSIFTVSVIDEKQVSRHEDHK